MSKKGLHDSRHGQGESPSGASKDTREPDYEVGYRCPPLQTRFKPGSSGNPKGRPKASKFRNIKDEIQQVYLREIPVRDGDKTRHVSGIVLLYRTLLNDGLKGDRRAALASAKLAVELGVLNIKDRLGLDLSQLTDVERAQCSNTLEILRKARVLERYRDPD